MVGNRGSVVESDFYTKLKKIDIQQGKIDKLFADHATQVCEAHNRVIVSFLQQVQGGTRPTTKESRENIRHNVHVACGCCRLSCWHLNSNLLFARVGSWEEADSKIESWEQLKQAKEGVLKQALGGVSCFDVGSFCDVAGC